MLTGTRGHYVLVTETSNKKRFVLDIDPEKETLFIMMYPEKDPDDNLRHYGAKEPFGYIKLSEEGLDLYHEKRIWLNSPDVRDFNNPQEREKQTRDYVEKFYANEIIVTDDKKRARYWD